MKSMKIKLKRTLYLLSGIFIIQLSSLAQTNPIGSFLKSPNVSEFNKFASFDTDLYNGVPKISIDLYESNYRGVPVNLSIGYSAGGVKIEQRPTWVGQNWNLITGGLVSRRKKGNIDELGYDSNNGYLKNFFNLDGGDWNTTKLEIIRNDIRNLWMINDLAPDEFDFALPNGKKGTLLFNHKGEWVSTSNDDGKLRFDVVLDSVRLINPKYISSGVVIGKIIKRIEITDVDGIKYVFGGHVNAIEFIRQAEDQMILHNQSIEANTWHISQIVLPNSETIDFTYDRGDYQYFMNENFMITENYVAGSDPMSRFSGGGVRSSYLICPSFLKSIASPQNTLVFYRSTSAQIQPDYHRMNQAFFGYRYHDLDWESSEFEMQPFLRSNSTKDIFQQLDSVIVRNLNDKVIKRIAFKYNSDITQRLFLNEVCKSSAKSGHVILKS